VQDSYRFDERTYGNLAVAGIHWRSVMEILHSASPRVRRHIGAVLHVAARTSEGQWLVVACIEEADDEYLVVSARELDEDEVAAVKAMIQGDVP
jgi:hypothetical protein